MWYSKGNMRVLFFSGAALILIGLGIVLLEQPVAGAVVICIGVFPSVIGFMGLRLNLMVDMRKPKNKQEPPEQ